MAYIIWHEISRSYIIWWPIYFDFFQDWWIMINFGGPISIKHFTCEQTYAHHWQNLIWRFSYIHQIILHQYFMPYGILIWPLL